MLKSLLTFFSLLICTLLWSQSSIRSKVNINDDWQYYENPTADVNLVKNGLAAKKINLPHTWNQWDVVDVEPGYRRSASWYCKKILIPYSKTNNYRLFFEGSNITTHVYINKVLAGSHQGGYVPFYIDISKFVKPGKLNDLDIRVDNSFDPDIIPSQKADFFIYGGIIRDLWLETLPSSYITSLKVSPYNVSDSSASTSIKFDVSSSINTDKCTVEVTLKDKSTGKTALTHAQALIGKLSNIELPILQNPMLWSPDIPNLYTIEIKLKDGRKTLDETSSQVGYRWFTFDDTGAFILNGKRLLLRGTHLHEDHAGTGAAMPDDLRVNDLRAIKDMGANFIRLAHYPQDPIIYKTCDELGLIVWDELPWCRGGIGKETWKANTSRLLSEQINMNFNHPSIFFWSLGNEVYWLPDFENGGDSAAINEYLTQLNSQAHTLDPYRMTAIRKYYEGSSIVDVFSPSIWSGWYAGLYDQYKHALETNLKKYKRFLHMEYGGNSLIGRHKDKPFDGKDKINSDPNWTEVANQVNVVNVAKYGDQSESYITDLFDWYLSTSESQPNFAGNAQWAFKDFATPLRPEESIPFMNLKGLVDREGKPKDAYYVFKSYWAKQPFTYIQSHSCDYRVNAVTNIHPIRVYANTDQVELFSNGKALGIKTKEKNKFPAGGLVWDVAFADGQNSLKAIGYNAGKQVYVDSMNLTFTSKMHDKAEEIALTYLRRKDGLFEVVATAIDQKGNRVVDYEKRVYFAHEGDGKLIINHGTSDKSHTLEMANGRATILLKPEKSGKCIIEARNHDFKGNYIIIDFSKTIVSNN
jgi:beta-galactosidase